MPASSPASNLREDESKVKDKVLHDLQLYGNDWFFPLWRRGQYKWVRILQYWYVLHCKWFSNLRSNHFDQGGTYTLYPARHWTHSMVSLHNYCHQLGERRFETRRLFCCLECKFRVRVVKNEIRSFRPK